MRLSNDRATISARVSHDGIDRLSIQQRSSGASGRLQRRVEELVGGGACSIVRTGLNSPRSGRSTSTPSAAAARSTSVVGMETIPTLIAPAVDSPHLRCFAKSVGPSGAHRFAVEEGARVTDRRQESDPPLAGLAFCHVREGVVGDLDEHPTRVASGQLGAHRAGSQNLRLHPRRADRVNQFIDRCDDLVLHAGDGHDDPSDFHRCCVARHDATASVTVDRASPGPWSLAPGHASSRWYEATGSKVAAVHPFQVLLDAAATGRDMTRRHRLSRSGRLPSSRSAPWLARSAPSSLPHSTKPSGSTWPCRPPTHFAVRLPRSCFALLDIGESAARGG